MAPKFRRRPTLADVQGINFSPRDANEALAALHGVADHFLSMNPRHPLGYFADVYGREMTCRARTEALREKGHGGYFQGSEYANFIFIGKFAGLYLKDLRAWLLANEGEAVQTEFSAWQLSFEYCQYNYEMGLSIPLIEAATGFIPHIINDLGKAFVLTSDDLRAAGVPIDLDALRMSHWNVSFLLSNASKSTLERYANEFHCPVARMMFDLGVEKSFPRIILWALMGLRIQAWYDFLALDRSSPEASKAILRRLDRKADLIGKLTLALFGDYDETRWKVTLYGASLATTMLDEIAGKSGLGARFGMPAPDATMESAGARPQGWWQPPGAEASVNPA